MFYVFKIAQNLVKNVLASDDFGTIGLYLGMLQDSRLKSKFDSQFLCREIRTLNTHGLSPCKVRNLAATLVCLKSVLACISIFGESLNFVNKFYFLIPKVRIFGKIAGNDFYDSEMNHSQLLVSGLYGLSQFQNIRLEMCSKMCGIKMSRTLSFKSVWSVCENLQGQGFF